MHAANSGFKGNLKTFVALCGLLTALSGCFFGKAAASDRNLQVHLDPADDNGVVNPLRGYYEWDHQNKVPQSKPLAESYERLSWAQLEENEGEYDFSFIDKRLAALSPGGRYAFGVMPLNTGYSKFNGVDVPAYLVRRLQKGFFFKSSYIPDWNDPYYIQRVEMLFKALAKKYDGDPRIAWIDIRMYGNWGEWHLSGIPYTDPSVNTQGALPATPETENKLIDAQAKPFPHTQLLMMTDDKRALVHALRLNTPIPIGMRRDSWGSVHFAEGFVDSSMPQADNDLILNRWKIAPVIVETYGGDKVFEVGPEGLVKQVRNYHVSAIGNGALGKWEQFTPEQQQGLLQAGAAAGYNLQLREVEYPEIMHPGGRVTINTSWLNIGSAPPYEKWQVSFVLLKNPDTAAWTGISGINPKTLSPSASLVQSDTLQLPPNIAPGAYSLAIAVVDPKHYRRPMSLPIKNASTKYGYIIGAVQIK